MIQKFAEILNEDYSSGNRIFKGSITDNKFNMSFASAGTPEPSFTAALKGIISSSNIRQTHIEVYIIRDSGSYMAFFISVIGAVFYFILYCRNPQNSDTLLWALGILILGSIVSMWLSESVTKDIKTKFELFLKDIGVAF